MQLPTMFVVVVLLAALCSAQPVVTSEPEQPHTSGVLRLKKRATVVVVGGPCPEGRTLLKNMCILDEKYREMKGDYDDSEPEQPHTSGVLRLKRQAPAIIHDSGACPEGQIKVKNICMDKEKYWAMQGDYDDSEPEQPHTSGVLRLKRQAPAILHDSGECPKGQIKVDINDRHICIDEEKYWAMNGEYDDLKEEEYITLTKSKEYV